MPIISQENQDALTQARLKSLLKYDPFTGNFWWKVNRRGTAKKNSVAGAVSTAGYRQIKINGPLYLSSRLAFLYMTGKWPKGYVDHINRNRADNRWENLRECTNAENQYNASIKKIIPAVVPGVCYNKADKKWHARINKDGKRKHLGFFDTIEEAAEARAKAVAKYHGEFAADHSQAVG